MKSFSVLPLISILLGGFSVFSLAQVEYKKPSEDVVKILDAPPTPTVTLSPTGDRMLLSEYLSMPSISHMARPILRLAGIRIDPASNGRQQTRYVSGLSVLQLADGSSKRLMLPEEANVTSTRWSHDGRWIAFSRESEHGIELWGGDPETGQVRILTENRLNATLGTGFRWMPDGRNIFCLIVPKGRGPAPQAPSVPTGPNIQETTGKVAAVRTYQDLLKDHFDEQLFEHYMTAQPALIDLENQRTLAIGKPGVYSSFTPSPDGNYFLVEKIKDPYSYSVPYRLFTRSVEVWDTTGRVVTRWRTSPFRMKFLFKACPLVPGRFVGVP